MLLVSCFLFGYLVGSIPIGLIVGQIAAGLDIRRVGTGNIGASNTWRNVGLAPAAVVGVGSFVQGFLPAWLSGLIFGQQVAVVAAGVGAVAGYGWSFMLRFRGGSAVGTATGALAAIAPLGLVPLLALYALGAILRQPAPGVLLGLISFVGYLKFTAEPLLLLLGCSVIVFAVIIKRFDGFQDDLHSDHAAAAFFERLLFDRRPGRGLVGPIE